MQIRTQRPGQPECPARRHFYPAMFQFPDAPDSQAYRLVTDTGEQVLR